MNALKWPPFLLYFCANGAAMLGQWMLRLVLGWMAWNLSESTFWTSLVVLAIWSPAGLLGPFIAVYAENWPMRLACFICIAVTASLCLSIWLIQVTVGHSLVSVLGLAIILGLIIAVYHPIRLVFVSLVVPKEYIKSAVGLNSLAFNTCRIAGPALAGAGIAALGISVTLLIATLLYIPLLVTLLIIVLQPRNHSYQEQSGFLARFHGGLVVIFQDLRLLYSLGVVAINGFFIRGIIEVQPAIVGQVFGGRSEDLAIATAAAGLGALVSSVVHSIGWLSFAGIQRLLLPLVVSSMMVAMGIALVETLHVMALLFALIGFTVTMVGIGTQTIVQLVVEDAYRARVLTWWSTLSFGGLGLGGIVIGVIGEWIKIQYAVSTLAGFGLLAAGYWWYRHRGIAQSL